MIGQWKDVTSSYTNVTIPVEDYPHFNFSADGKYFVYMNLTVPFLDTRQQFCGEPLAC